MNHIFRNNFLSYVSLTPWYYWSNEEANVFTKKEARYLFKILPFTKCFEGHTTRSYLGYENVLKRKIDYITFLREPISRYISQYNYQKEVMKIDWDIKEFLNEMRFNNLMTKRIAGEYDLDKAKRILFEDFSFVGFCETFDESLILMAHALKLSRFCPYYKRRNVSSNVNYRNDCIRKGNMLERIRHNNRLDIELYDFAWSRIYNTYKKTYKGNLEEEVEKLRVLNKDYVPNKTKCFLNRTYRYIVYRNLEYAIKGLFHKRRL